MKRLLTIFVLLAVPAAAQENRGAASAPSGGGGGGAVHGGTAGTHAGPATSGGGGGGSAAGGGGGSSSGGSGSAGAGSGGARVGVGGRHAATGGSGVAVSRAPERGGTSGTAVGRSDGTRDARTPDGGPAGVPPHARPRDGNEPIVGTAVPRGSVPPTGGGTVVVGGTPLYPWWFGGAGYYGGYYGGYYDPWFGGYGGYGGYYDPQPVYSGSYSDEGALRLKIKPREAEVYVDGYYVGIVDDFDGVFQKLHIESGPHRIEIRAPGYDPLTFEVRITPDHATTYRGELKKIQ